MPHYKTQKCARCWTEIEALSAYDYDHETGKSYHSDGVEGCLRSMGARLETMRERLDEMQGIPQE